MTQNPFSAAFLAQLKEKEASANATSQSGSQASPPPAVSPAQPLEPDHVEEVKDSQDRLIQRIPFKEGKIEGTVEVYNPETQTLTHKMPYVQGVLEGTLIAYDETETIIQEIPYIQGKKTGVGCFYYLGGKISEITYEDDQMNGPAIFYGPNGDIHTLASYKDNRFEGEFLAFDAKKNLIRQCMYSKGKLEGPSRTFYPSGMVPEECKLFEECTYKDNKILGQQLQYFEEGALMRRITYNEEGKPIKEETFSRDGNPMAERDINPKPQKTL